MESLLLDQLTRQQSDIVFRPYATMSVFAAPGSGKTTVLTEHIRFQLQQRLLQPDQIMAVTFTKQAALEMAIRIKNRYSGLERRHIESLRIGTFHAQMFALLLSDNPNIPVLLDPSEQFQMMRSALQLQSLPDTAQHVHKAMMMLTRTRSTWPFKENLKKRDKRLIEQYEKLKTRACRWDFDDILVHACQLFETGKAAGFDRPVRYILVDEFQDTNNIQWTILQYLATLLKAKLFVVGDDDQSIYGFRGANPSWLVNFASWYPDSSSYELSVNFRSDTTIVQCAKSLIQHNRGRQPKNIVGCNRQKGDVQTLRWRSEDEEAAAVAHWIRQRRGERTAAVLARTRKQLQQTWSMLPKDCQQTTEFRTFHDAKGKEWDTVHVVGAVEANPYLSVHSVSAESIEEERRLFYVAVTRARHRLYVHSPQRVQNRKFRPLKFIEECQIQGEP